MILCSKSKVGKLWHMLPALVQPLSYECFLCFRGLFKNKNNTMQQIRKCPSEPKIRTILTFTGKAY